MSPTPNNGLSVRRRPSFFTTIRPRTAGGEQCLDRAGGPFHLASWAAPDTPNFSETVSKTGDINVHDALVPSDADSLKPLENRPHRKSISCIRYGVNELRAAVRRLSVTIRHMSHRRASETHIDEEKTSNGFLSGHYRKGSKNGGCLTHGMRRRSFNNFYSLRRSQSHIPSVSLQVPPNKPRSPLFPDELSGGQAARAAAAAQNEIIRLERGPVTDDQCDLYIRPGDNTKVGFDSESGIEIDIQEGVREIQDDLDVVRKDPVSYFPTELMCHILSFLDAESVKNAELVSHAWNAQASSRHVWRDVFRSEYRHGGHMVNTKPQRPKPKGLGKARPNQDWKKMYAVRQALNNRWNEGKAAAIYLHGHKDSVYCVQFDENKIVTGSRDRTIRIWDAHYPWPCLKVIGAIHDRSESPQLNPLALEPQPAAFGSSPFISICPPAKPASELMKSEVVNADEYHHASVLCLQYDDDFMVTGSSDHSCIVWDVKDDHKPIRRLEGHSAGVLDICFDHRYVISCSKDTTICVWDLHTGELVKRLLGHRGPVNAVQLRGDLVVSASGDGVSKLWNIQSGLCIKEFASRDRGLACVEFSEDARTILAGGNAQIIYQFDANTGELVNELKGHTGLVRSLHMDTENDRVISGSYDMSVKVFDAKTGKLSLDLPGWTTSWMLSAKSDYRRIVATSQDSRAVIMDFGYGLDGIELLEEC